LTDDLPLALTDTVKAVSESETEPFMVEEGPASGSVTSVVGAGAVRYEHATALGKGGMGEVVEVLDREFNRRVAMKTLLGESVTQDALDLFVAEAQINSQLEHPNMVPVHDIGVGPDGKPYFTMRLVRGHTSLKELIARLKAGDPETHAAYSFEHRVHLIQQVCHALDYAHQRGVVHCDIKPDNIVVGDCGELFIVDWGISQLVSEGERAHPHGTVETSNGLEDTAAALYGTVLYMAPERMRAADTATPGTDLYSVCAVLYELLSLEHYLGPASAGSQVVAMYHALNEPRVSAERHLHPVNGRVPRTLSQVCKRGLAIDPAARFQSVGELRAALRCWVEGRIPIICPGTMMQRGTLPTRGHASGGYHWA
jgi:eukaryotic-like serine/threonine-protein kinase